MSAALQAKGLGKRYRDGERIHDAVRAVDLELPAGALWVLSGPSGSGKSTLLALLSGMLAPTEGEVELLGQPFSRLRDHHRTARRREAMGVVFQGLGLIDSMALLENVTLPCVPLGGPTPAEVERARALLERFDLGGREGAAAATLSGGERQRAAIVRALVLSPKVLILDEPTAHLDAERADGVVALLAKLRDEGHALLAATHDPRLADDPRVDRRLRLVDGQLEPAC